MSPYNETARIISEHSILTGAPSDDYHGITVIFGNESSGKTTLLKEVVMELLDAQVFTSYASLADSEIRIFPTEYRLPMHYDRAPITEDDNGNATTQADVIIVPKMQDSVSLDLLSLAQTTGKPVFLEINANTVQEALAKLTLLHRNDYRGFDANDAKRLAHCKINKISDGLFEKTVEWHRR